MSWERANPVALMGYVIKKKSATAGGDYSA